MCTEAGCVLSTGLANNQLTGKDGPFSPRRRPQAMAPGNGPTSSQHSELLAHVRALCRDPNAANLTDEDAGRLHLLSGLLFQPSQENVHSRLLPIFLKNFISLFP